VPTGTDHSPRRCTPPRDGGDGSMIDRLHRVRSPLFGPPRDRFGRVRRTVVTSASATAGERPRRVRVSPRATALWRGAYAPGEPDSSINPRLATRRVRFYALFGQKWLERTIPSAALFPYKLPVKSTARQGESRFMGISLAIATIATLLSLQTLEVSTRRSRGWIT
jgi:hypothetical protein